MRHEPTRILLAVDIGNSTVGFGLFPDPERGDPLFTVKIPTRPFRNANTYKRVISGLIRQGLSTKIRAMRLRYKLDAVLASVVPALNRPVSEALKAASGSPPLIVGARVKSGLAFDVAQPGRVGADRIANAAAAFHRTGKPTAVVDFGTATTITVVGKEGTFLGGAISPGIQLMQRALHAETAKLPLIPLDRPGSALGKDTVSSIASGVIRGTAGAAESLIKDIEKELNFKLRLILTGGHAQLMSPLLKRAHILAPNLTFEGLRLIYLKTRNTP